MASILIDLCEQTGIEVIESLKLHTIDEFVESFYRKQLVQLAVDIMPLEGKRLF